MKVGHLEQRKAVKVLGRDRNFYRHLFLLPVDHVERGAVFNADQDFVFLVFNYSSGYLSLEILLLLVLLELEGLLAFLYDLPEGDSSHCCDADLFLVEKHILVLD